MLDSLQLLCHLLAFRDTHVGSGRRHLLCLSLQPAHLCLRDPHSIAQFLRCLRRLLPKLLNRSLSVCLLLVQLGLEHPNRLLLLLLGLGLVLLARRCLLHLHQRCLQLLDPAQELTLAQLQLCDDRLARIGALLQLSLQRLRTLQLAQTSPVVGVQVVVPDASFLQLALRLLVRCAKLSDLGFQLDHPTLEPTERSAIWRKRRH